MISRNPVDFKINERRYREVFRNRRDCLVVTGLKSDGLYAQGLKLSDGRILPAVNVIVVEKSQPYELRMVADEKGKEV